jgi:hypothetical protein
MFVSSLSWQTDRFQYINGFKKAFSHQRASTMEWLEKTRPAFAYLYVPYGGQRYLLVVCTVLTRYSTACCTAAVYIAAAWATDCLTVHAMLISHPVQSP